MQGTHGTAISPQGTITGTFDSNGNHGYVRARDGTFITFDVPGAGIGPFHGTYAISINPAETITGMSIDASGLAHGYVRASDGAITTFDAPGAGKGSGQGTFPSDINPAGAIAGDYLDASKVFHGFVRSPKGAITTFDAPGAGTGPFQGTFPAGADGLNPAGAITGSYQERATSITASSARLTAPSPRSTFQAQALAPSRARCCQASTLREPSLARSLTGVA
jgi:hypothetical protein